MKKYLTMILLLPIFAVHGNSLSEVNKLLREYRDKLKPILQDMKNVNIEHYHLYIKRFKSTLADFHKDLKKYKLLKQFIEFKALIGELEKLRYEADNIISPQKRELSKTEKANLKKIEQEFASLISSYDKDELDAYIGWLGASKNGRYPASGKDYSYIEFGDQSNNFLRSRNSIMGKYDRIMDMINILVKYYKVCINMDEKRRIGDVGKKAVTLKLHYEKAIKTYNENK